MTTNVEKSIEVDVPVSTAYNQWTQFEEFPHFMGGVTKVTQLTDDRLEWVAEIAGVKRQWEAKILEQVPDQKVAWAATQGATNAGSVRFEARDQGLVEEAARRLAESRDPGIVPAIFLVGAARHAADRRWAPPGTIARNFYRALVRR